MRRRFCYTDDTPHPIYPLLLRNLDCIMLTISIRLLKLDAYTYTNLRRLYDRAFPIMHFCELPPRSGFRLARDAHDEMGYLKEVSLLRKVSKFLRTTEGRVEGRLSASQVALRAQPQEKEGR
jgi:hypothetical protein